MCQWKQYDVTVAGGGPSGVAAAVAAARNGCKTLLIERGSCLGGMATQALVPAFGPFTNAEVDLIGGIGREILESLKKDGYRNPFYDRKTDRIEGIDWYQIDPERLKCVLDEIVLESQCDILFHTDIIEVAKTDRTINAVCAFCKGKKEWIHTKYLIDCTGNADLAEMSGVGFDYGDADGNVQAGWVAGIDVAKFIDYVRSVNEDGNLSKACERAMKNGEFPKDEMKVGGMALQAEGVAGLNFGHSYNLSPLDPWEISRSETEARRRLPELVKFLRNYVPGMENCVLVSSGSGIGVRESRRIHGRYTLTSEDYFRRADFEDAIAYYSSPVDIHPAVPDQGAEMESNYQKWRYGNGECYGIPYFFEAGFFADLSSLEAEAKDQIVDYVYEAGKDESGVLRALSYQVTPGAIIYRRDLAQEIFGTDDPDAMSAKFKDFDTILETAQEVKDAGYRIFSDSGNLRWYANAGSAWVVDGVLQVSDAKLGYMDAAVKLYQDELVAFAPEWSAAWYASMAGELPLDAGWSDLAELDGAEMTQVFSYSLPSWGALIVRDNANDNKGNFGVCSGPCSYFGGGTFIGVNEYSEHKDLATDFVKFCTLNEDTAQWWLETSNGDVVSNKAVLDANQDYENESFGNQRTYEFYLKEANNIDYSVVTKYDDSIGNFWGASIEAIQKGEITREEAIEDFYMQVETTFPEITVNR